jgi:hypothetical protein
MSDVTPAASKNVISDEFKSRAEALLKDYDRAFENQKENGPSIVIPIIANYGELALQMLRFLVKENVDEPAASTEGEAP